MTNHVIAAVKLWRGQRGVLAKLRQLHLGEAALAQVLQHHIIVDLCIYMMKYMKLTEIKAAWDSNARRRESCTVALSGGDS